MFFERIRTLFGNSVLFVSLSTFYLRFAKYKLRCFARKYYKYILRIRLFFIQKGESSRIFVSVPVIYFSIILKFRRFSEHRLGYFSHRSEVHVSIFNCCSKFIAVVQYSIDRIVKNVRVSETWATYKLSIILTIRM